jgi:tRNA pseudouridine55 synthase
MNITSQPISSISDFQEGKVLLIDKPLTWTSFDVVNKIRYQIKYLKGIKKIKVGHAGTLDPLATGLLIVCTGKYTKRIHEIQNAEKEYTGTFVLGATRPSYDKETPIDEEFPIDNITDKDIIKAAKNLTGSIQQIPPIYSAQRINGVRAYKKARKNQPIQMEAKQVTISEFEITNIDLPTVSFRVVCSKGTYIRSLVHDLGKGVNNGAFLASLCRTRIGDFKLKDGLSLEEFLK